MGTLQQEHDAVEHGANGALGCDAGIKRFHYICVAPLWGYCISA